MSRRAPRAITSEGTDDAGNHLVIIRTPRGDVLRVTVTDDGSLDYQHTAARLRQTAPSPRLAALMARQRQKALNPYPAAGHAADHKETNTDGNHRATPA